MEAWLQQWFSLLLRWSHFIVGIAWIGASFYFNWLENQLQRRSAPDNGEQPDPIAGDLWAVHGGGFYYLQKFRVAPNQLPEPLHWFKYEAYFTWISGFALLAVVYYWNARVYLLDPAVSAISPGTGIAIGLVSLLASWLVYDGLCRSPLKQKPALLGQLIFAWFAFLAWLLGQYLSGRAAYIHVGAAIGTVMVANVFFVIIPAQKELVAALVEGRQPQASKGENALLRSRHNNYLTLPVLFIMISNHYPATYGSTYNWLILIVFSLSAVGIRHWFNIRHLPQYNPWILPL
ncbi:MAG TPA: urate hydroxylase PuuD, partial [Xanthomonadales bacterium]|nr:urate hydroxylase PuuD [Xanthomonadales bacterium]